jgi:hypothetical protein
MKRLAVIWTAVALLFPSPVLAVTLTDVLKNDFVAFSTLQRDSGGYLIFLQKLHSIYVCEIIAATSRCRLLDSNNQLN